MRKFFICLLLAKTCVSFSQDTAFYQNIEWSPDGKRICTEVIHHSNSNLSFEVYIININTKEIERKIEGAVFPAWSPTGKFIAYSKKNTSPHGLDIWLLNISTGDTIRLTNDTARNSGLSFSPDEKQICFSSDREGGRNLFKMNIDGSNIERLTFDSARYFNPAWSPNGNKIVYYRERGDHRDKVYTLDISSKKETNVTNDSLHDIYPSWLPDSKTIIYTFSDPLQPASRNQIGIISDNGTNKSTLKNNTESFFARVSADGSKVAIIKGTWPASDIYIEDINGNNVDCVTCNLRGN